MRRWTVLVMETSLVLRNLVTKSMDGWMEVKLGLHVLVGGAECTLHITSITAIDPYQLNNK